VFDVGVGSVGAQFMVGCTRASDLRDEMRERLASFDRRLLALEIVVRGEDGRNGMKAKLIELCQRFYAFEKKAIRWISIGTSLPGIVLGGVAVLRFLGKA
jgi:hypothetical protein